MKIIRKTILLLTVLVMALSASLCACGEGDGQPRSVSSPEDARQWMEIFLSDAPDGLEDMYLLTEQMRAAAAAAGGMKGLAASLSPLGQIQRICPAREGKAGGYTAYYVPCVFSAMPADLILVMDRGAIAGLTTGPFTGDAEEKPSPGTWESRELALPCPDLEGSLPGTLTLPRGEGPFPAVVLVHGSGPSDRDETLLNVKPFRDLAEGLAEKGIAVYRYDKRTYAYVQEMAADRGITLAEETVLDAAAAVQLLSAQQEIDPERIFVLGHSLGGSAIPAVDRALRDMPCRACGYIFMAASPRPLDVLMREQYDYLYSLLPEVTPEQQAEKDALFAQLDRVADPDSLTEDDLIAGAYAPYWKYLAAYDITGVAAEITVPCLVLQGLEDYQVTEKDLSIWQQAFGQKENWRFIAYPGLTHCFTPGLKTEGAGAYARQEKVDSAVITDIADFVSAPPASAQVGAVKGILDRGVLLVGTAGDYQPMSFLDPGSGTYVGFDAELAQDLAVYLGVGLQYVPTSWPTLMEDTLGGKFDLALCGITVTEERRERALMSDGYLENGKTVLCRAEDADKYASLADINRPSVRVMENPGGLNEKFARENLPDAQLTIHPVNQEIPGLIAEGAADVMITEVMEAGFYAGLDSRLAAPLIHTPFTRGQLGVLMPRGSEDLLQAVNRFLELERSSGRLEELAEKYIYLQAAPETEAEPAA